MPIPSLEFYDSDNRNVKIYMIKDPVENTSASATPEWVVKMDDLLESKQKKFEKYSELLGYDLYVGRESKSGASGELNSAGVVQHSDVYIVFRVEISMPKILGKLYKGIKIDEILLKRLTHAGDTGQEKQIISFKTCRVDFVKQITNDLLIVKFRPIVRDDTVFKWDQDSNSSTGQTHELFNFSTNTAEGG